MNEAITIEKQALAELLNSAFRKGFQQALEVLKVLEPTSGWNEDQLQELIKNL